MEENNIQAGPVVESNSPKVKPSRLRHPLVEIFDKEFKNTWLTVIGFTRDHPSRSVYLCKCRCGADVRVSYSELNRGTTRSCGCWRRFNVGRLQTTHGQSRGNGGRKTPAYMSWSKMVTRCTSVSDVHYHHYGGKGVRICSTLRDFRKFFEVMGERPNRMTLDRIDSKLNYSCGDCDDCRENNWDKNVRWATKNTQVNNTSRNHFLEFGGERMTIAHWAVKKGWEYHVLWNRISDGWSTERALTTPLKQSALSRVQT